MGRTIELNRQSFTVVGVADEGTDTGNSCRMGYVAPLPAEPLLSRRASLRRRPATVVQPDGPPERRYGSAQVRAELAVIAARLDAPEPGRSTALTVERATLMTVPLLSARSRRAVPRPSS